MVKLFFSYSHKDEELRNQLADHLVMLVRQGVVETVHDRCIRAGEDLDGEIDRYVEEADVILCLLSPDFFASNYCYSTEMARALERHKAGEAKVIPVILRHCEWLKSPLSKLRATPRDGKPVKAWADQDEAFLDIATDIRNVVEGIAGQKNLHTDEIQPRQIGGAVERRRPRSANLQVKREITDLERDRFLRSSYDYVREYIANSLGELTARHPEIEVMFTKLDEDRFIAKGYRGGKRVSAITVFIGGMAGGSTRAISFNFGDDGRTSSSNGMFSIAGDSSLGFQSLFDVFGSQRDKFLSPEDVAEDIWSKFVEPFQG